MRDSMLPAACSRIMFWCMLTPALSADWEPSYSVQSVSLPLQMNWLFTQAGLNTEVIGWWCLLLAAKSVLNACEKRLIEFIDFLSCGKKRVDLLLCLVKVVTVLSICFHMPPFETKEVVQCMESLFFGVNIKIRFLLSWVSPLLKHNLVNLCCVLHLCTRMPWWE